MSAVSILHKTKLAIRKAKVLYYAKGFIRLLVPTSFYNWQLEKKLNALSEYEMTDLMARVNYYNKLQKSSGINDHSVRLAVMKKVKNPKAYYFDTFEYTRYFNQDFKFNYLFGDITHVADEPTIQKSRPIDSNNLNAVLLKLDKKRHFLFVKDRKKFKDKKNMLIGRAAISQPHRIRFMELYFGHPMCDLGQINKKEGNLAWLKPKISILDHLEYKFILSLEGHDVATNLKWIMASSSIAVMPKPKYETWFMEGRLVPDFHYIMIKDDYSDLEEKLLYYISNPDKALEIIRNANDYVKQFFNEEKEDLISILVLKKYFECTSQYK